LIPVLTHLGEHARPVEDRHGHVEDQEVVGVFLELEEALLAVFCFFDVETELARVLRHDHAHGAAVIDSEDLRHGALLGISRCFLARA